MHEGFNIYVSDHINKAPSPQSFEGLSVGEVRSFIMDLIRRDIKKNNIEFLTSTPTLRSFKESRGFPHENFVMEENAMENKKDTVREMDELLYDIMSVHELTGNVWRFSDKTLMIIKK